MKTTLHFVIFYAGMIIVSFYFGSCDLHWVHMPILHSVLGVLAPVNLPQVKSLLWLDVGIILSLSWLCKGTWCRQSAFAWRDSSHLCPVICAPLQVGPCRSVPCIVTQA